MTRKEEIYNAMGDAEWKHIDGTKDIELFDMGFKEGAVWADAHPHWISVDDELPKINPNDSEWEYRDDVIVALKDGSIAVGRYERYNSTGEHYWMLYGVDKDLVVTHWMPLPSVEHLKESEDDKMKREILELVSISGIDYNQFEEIKDWLEKQGEQPTDKIEPTPAWSEEDEEMLMWLCRIIHSQRMRKEITLKEESELGEWMDKWLNHNPQTKQGKQLDADNVWLQNYLSNVICLVNQFKKDFGL